MITDTELAEMRATSTAALPDVGTITRPVKAGTLNEVSGDWTPGTETAVYTGAMRVRPAGTEDQQRIFGDVDVTTLRYTLTVPHDTPAVKIDDRVTVTTSSDPHIAATPFKVVAVMTGSWLIDRRIGLEVDE